MSSLPYHQFEQITQIKKHKDERKKYKGLYEELKKPPHEKATKLIYIEIKNTYNFTLMELKNIIDPNNKIEILIKYAQNVHANGNESSASHVKITFCLFPKLLLDDSFFDSNYETSFFMHEIELPSGKIFQEYKNRCIVFAHFKVEVYMNMFNLIG
jgi:hypothetical protein